MYPSNSAFQVQAEDAGVSKVLFWQKVYCAAMGLMYLSVMVLGAVLMLFADEFASAGRDVPELLIQGFVFAAMGAIFTAAFLASFFLPRRPWAWVYNLVLISVGLTSCCCIPAAIPLLIFWIKPEVKGFFSKADYAPFVYQASSEEPASTQEGVGMAEEATEKQGDVEAQNKAQNNEGSENPPA